MKLKQDTAVRLHMTLLFLTALLKVKKDASDNPFNLFRDIDVTAVYGGCCGGSFRRVFIQTKSSGWFPHSTLVKGSDAVAYLMETIQSAMDSN